MKAMKKFAFYTLAVLVFSALAAATACAASFTFSNSLNIRISVTMAYVDAGSGVMTTRGWWHVEPGGQTVINVNADESGGVYYAAYNKGQYYDSGAGGSSQIKRWANPRTFTYTFDGQPNDDGVWYGTFYRISGRSVRIDTSEAPRGGTLESRPKLAENTAKPSVKTAGNAEGREAIGDRLSTENLPKGELEAASKETLAYLRNRIYANHGYPFKTKQWSEEFARCDWYKPNPDFSEKLFNSYEVENLKNIMAEEKRK